MTINGFAGHDGDLDVPDWMKTLDGSKPSKLIPGEVTENPTTDLTTPGPDDDDIAPGEIEFIPYRRPVLSRTGSAAIVVAGTTARGGWNITRWLCHGLAASTLLGYRYVRAHDHIESLGGMDGAKWSKVHQTRGRRWRFLGWCTGGLTAADLLSWWGLDQGAGFSNLTALATAPTVEVLAAGAALTLYGRYRLNANLAPTEIIAPEDIDDGDEPFPLAWCKDGQQVSECVSRALAYEGVDTRSISILGNRPWGWEVDITLKNSTPGRVNAAADQLDAHFDLPQGGTLIEPDPDRSSHITLRLVLSDPFANMAAPAVHAPNSLSVRDAAVYGRGMDGSPLEFRLRGMSALIIGVSGSAKTKGALRCLAEGITACRDAIAIEMDPVKDGLSEFAGAMAAPPVRGGKDCTEWLSRLVRIAGVRNRIKSELDMGDLWEPSPENPSIFAIVDEFIYLPPEAKALAIELLRIGRETGVHLIFAAQEATEDSLGDAIADSVTYRIMLAARATDIRLVLGTGAAADGFRPDRLRPAVDDERVYDAGKFYIKGPGYLRPIQWRWNRLDRTQIKQAVAERAAAGRPWFDRRSLAAADLLHVITRDGDAAHAGLADQLDALAAQGGIDDARLVAVLVREFDLAGAEFLPTSEVLLPALAAVSDGMTADKLGQLLRRHAPKVAATRGDWEGVPGRPRGWSRAAVEQAAAGLIDPAKARREAG
jgi:hypothetical protein